MEMSEGRVQVCLDNPGGLKLMSVCQWAGWPAIRNPLTRLLIISLVNSLRLCARARARERDRERERLPARVGLPSHTGWGSELPQNTSKKR